tara:strand:+ start:2019 stop:2207 length:189 start_codon:yes stop_codon:yes gene_type:complete
MTNCKNCAAPISKMKCNYCGTCYNNSKAEVTSFDSKGKEFISCDAQYGFAIADTVAIKYWGN